MSSYDPTRQVCLDPDNEEQMKCLVRAYYGVPYPPHLAGRMADAVRSLLEPAEPEGLAAVIVDGDGVKRQLYLNRGGERLWFPCDLQGFGYEVAVLARWSDLPRPIRVIRQGLTEQELGR